MRQGVVLHLLRAQEVPGVPGGPLGAGRPEVGQGKGQRGSCLAAAAAGSRGPCCLGRRVGSNRLVAGGVQVREVGGWVTCMIACLDAVCQFLLLPVPPLLMCPGGAIIPGGYPGGCTLPGR